MVDKAPDRVTDLDRFFHSTDDWGYADEFVVQVMGGITVLCWHIFERGQRQYALWSKHHMLPAGGIEHATVQATTQPQSWE